jgi:hypothetical protein
MLAFLKGRASDRKLRLFAVACVWERGVMVRYEPNRRFLAEFVRFADGDGTLRKARAARRAAFATWGQISILDCPDPDRDAWETAAGVAGPANPTELLNAGRAARRNAAQARLLRDVFGNPFRPAAFDPAWRTADVLSVARAAYEAGFPNSGYLDAAPLGVLADALEEAGAGGELLAHLRWAGPHVRGCWAVDLAAGKS